jgi:MoaA/NifB/PqqE/SkfB family radical SAM enzyme
MCFRHTWFDEPICDLSLEDYRQVLASMPRTVETIFFGGMGEPLFHRDILEMIRLAAETGVEVELLTNGTLLT